VVDAAVVGEDVPAPADLGELVAEVEVTIAQQGLTVTMLQRFGKPAFTICDIADEMNVDLIVMGSRGLDDDHAKESVTSRVISLSPCPILVIP
jgi:nucleotide-binding universal stress UspA family protein